MRLLGCFDQKRTFDSIMTEEDEEIIAAKSLDRASVATYYDELSGIFNRGVLDYFNGNGSEGRSGEEENRKEWLVNATLVIRLLYDLAVDAYDRAQQTSLQLASGCCLASSLRECKNSSSSSSKTTRDRHLSLTSSVSPVTDSPTHRSSSFTTGHQQQQPMLVHPGVILALFQLIPSVWRKKTDDDGDEANIAASTALQQLVTDVIQSLLVHSERNVQILCDVAFPAEMLKRASWAISAAGGSTTDEHHHKINGSLVAILEQLGRQALEPKDLREFVRLGDPLNCLLPSATNGGGGKGHPLPLSRIQSLVAMASINPSSAHHLHHHHRGSPSLTAPPFVEFDMQPEGFGCLFLPSVAPQCIVGGGGVAGGPSMATTMTGGVGGGGDRIFPAPTGMSYSTWICVDKFSDPRLDPHGIRLLVTINELKSAKQL